MRPLLILFLFFWTVNSAQGQMPCPSYINEEVCLLVTPAPLDTAKINRARSRYAIVCYVAPGYTYALKTVNPLFEIISFTISAEYPDEELAEAACQGNWSATVQQIYQGAAPGGRIDFFCIKARHTNGKIYTLKPFHLTAGK